MNLTNFLDKNTLFIIQKLNASFDSHDFIQQFLKDYEKEYVLFLNSYINSKAIFRTLHSNIGKYLITNYESLNILPANNKVKSDNIKDYKSPNQKWIKK